MHTSLLLPTVLALANLAQAQFPKQPSGVTTHHSKLHKDVVFSYKENDICETTPNVTSYSGFVHLPAKVLQDVGDYDISTFFWYFEARNNPEEAPLAIYLAGGPGESSTYSAMSSESGPCYVNPDGKTTTLNPWSFNNHVNMLYIDQPVQAGFSYNSLINGTFDLVSNIIEPLASGESIPASNSTFGVGTYASQTSSTTVNTTMGAARALWHFAENWLTSFPGYKTKSNSLSIWANSYGGYWAPATTAYFEKQLAASSHEVLKNIKIDTMGITNGCIDQLLQAPGYPEIAYNNTYGVQFINETIYEQAMNNFTKEGGCRDLIEQCRDLAAEGDPDYIGSNVTVNQACQDATAYCMYYVIAAFDEATGRDDFDFAIEDESTCPWYKPVYTYFSQDSVLDAMALPLNFSWDSNVVTDNFGFNFADLTVGTGDAFRKSIADFEYVLDTGTKVSMIYGDRDYRCGWIGAENLANSANWSGKSKFQTSGYSPIITNSTYHGGVAKQYGNFSFSRVFDAGHAVSAYQPETVYRIFQRAMFGLDIPSGEIQTSGGSGFQTEGPLSSWGWKNTLPKESPSTCMVEGAFQESSVWAD